jgi:phosphatidate cytidylyltransferase
MKQRVISAIVMIALVVPIFIIGGNLYKLAIFVIAMLGMKEYLDIKETKKELPIFIKLMAYLFVPMVLLTVDVNNKLVMTVDFRVITSLIIVLLLPVVLYHKRETYSINDANYVFMGIMFLGIAMSLFITYFEMNKNLLLYLVLITVITDTFAYLTGMLVGKHKLLEVISPKKTIEGFIGGTFFGVFVAALFYATVVDQSAALVALIPVTFALSVIGQLGDLFFSAIKRYFNKKDFSNLMPGHGGILDRLDSLIFVLLAYSFFLNIL